MSGILLFVGIVAGIVAGIAGVARRLGASRLMAFSIPIVPMVVIMVCFLFTNKAETGEGGAVPYWIGVGIWLLIGLPVSAVTVFVVPNKNANRSN